MNELTRSMIESGWWNGFWFGLAAGFFIGMAATIVLSTMLALDKKR